MALLGHGGGGQAERVVLGQTRAALAPAGCSLTQAAALPLAALTALQALRGRAHLPVRSPGSRVLVVGACDGIGSYAVQLRKLAGAHVTAVASGPKLPYAVELVADERIDRGEQDTLRLGGHWDVIVDTPGTSTSRTPVTPWRRAACSSPPGPSVETPCDRSRPDPLLGPGFASRPS